MRSLRIPTLVENPWVLGAVFGVTIGVLSGMSRAPIVQHLLSSVFGVIVGLLASYMMKSRPAEEIDQNSETTGEINEKKQGKGEERTTQSLSFSRQSISAAFLAFCLAILLGLSSGVVIKNLGAKKVLERTTLRSVDLTGMPSDDAARLVLLQRQLQDLGVANATNDLLVSKIESELRHLPQQQVAYSCDQYEVFVSRAAPIVQRLRKFSHSNLAELVDQEYRMRELLGQAKSSIQDLQQVSSDQPGLSASRVSIPESLIAADAFSAYEWHDVVESLPTELQIRAAVLALAELRKVQNGSKRPLDKVWQDVEETFKRRGGKTPEDTALETYQKILQNSPYSLLQ